MKNKKILSATLALATLLSALPTLGVVSASAQQSIYPVDAYFLDFVADDIGDSEITYTSSLLYDETLTATGYEYVFSVDGENGYALLQEVQIGANTLYEVEELSFSGESPFAQCDGLPVYITFNLYLDCVDGTLYDLATGETVADETLAWATTKRFGYYGGGSYTTETYTITYDHKTSETYISQYGLPTYVPITGTSCANAAGSIVIGYYDRFYENLIPNEVTYMTLGNNLMYKPVTAGVQDVCLDLYDLMGTNEYGTTFAGFEAGLASLVQRQGYTYSSTSVFTSGSFDFNKYKTAVESGKPVALFLNNYAIYNHTTTSGNVDTISNDVSPYTHVAVACGYKCDTYFNSSNSVISTQRYLRVSSGLALYDLCYINASAYTTINNAIAITIQ